MGCCRWHSATAPQGIQSFRLAKRSQSDPPMVIGECIGCEFRNSSRSSDPSPAGVARSYWKTALQASIANAGKPNQKKEALRSTPRPETRTWPPMPAPGLKGRFQQRQMREHPETPCTNAKTTHALKSALQAWKPTFWGCPRPRAAPWAFGNRPFRPESQLQAEQKRNTGFRGTLGFVGHGTG